MGRLRSGRPWERATRARASAPRRRAGSLRVGNCPNCATSQLTPTASPRFNAVMQPPLATTFSIGALRDLQRRRLGNCAVSLDVADEST